MDTTPLESVPASDVKKSREEWNPSYLVNTLKVAMSEAKRLGQYPIVWNHGLDEACEKELKEQGYTYTQTSKWQYLLYSEEDKDGKWLDMYKQPGYKPHRLDHVIPPAYTEKRFPTNG